MFDIETVEKWRTMESLLLEQSYFVVAMQYNYDLPDGFITTFLPHGLDSDLPKIEIRTWSKEVKDAIMKYDV